MRINRQGMQLSEAKRCSEMPSQLNWPLSASGDEPLHRTVAIGRPGIAWAMEGLMGVDLPFPTEMENKFLALRFFLIPNHPKP